MKESRWKEKLRSWLQGRYGMDEFSNFLIFLALGIMLVTLTRYSRLLYYLSMLPLVYNVYRTFSRKIEQRDKERQAYLRIRNALLKKPREWVWMWQQRKTHRFFTCPNCKTKVRIQKPAAGSKVKIRCPHCGQVFEKRI